jgi:hypothetical protein
VDAPLPGLCSRIAQRLNVLLLLGFSLAAAALGKGRVLARLGLVGVMMAFLNILHLPLSFVLSI